MARERKRWIYAAAARHGYVQSGLGRGACAHVAMRLANGRARTSGYVLMGQAARVPALPQAARGLSTPRAGPI